MQIALFSYFLSNVTLGLKSPGATPTSRAELRPVERDLVLVPRFSLLCGLLPEDLLAKICSSSKGLLPWTLVAAAPPEPWLERAGLSLWLWAVLWPFR